MLYLCCSFDYCRLIFGRTLSALYRSIFCFTLARCSALCSFIVVDDGSMWFELRTYIFLLVLHIFLLVLRTGCTDCSFLYKYECSVITRLHVYLGFYFTYNIDYVRKGDCRQNLVSPFHSAPPNLLFLVQLFPFFSLNTMISQ